MTLTRYGPSAWLLRFAGKADAAAFAESRRLVSALERRPLADLAEAVPAFTTLLFRFGGTAPAESILRDWLETAPEADVAAPEGRRHELPVSYAGPDLERVAERSGLSVAEVVERHSAPGFPYLGGLDPVLHTPRLASPRLRIAPGSVAIGGEHTGIYSVASPGGWNLIGQTPVTLFDPRAGSPDAMFLVRAGDSVRFRPAGEMGRVNPAAMPVAEERAGAPRLRILGAGVGIGLQDLGRPGYGRFGVPPGGAMDPAAAAAANRLVDNPGSAAVLELCLQGQRFMALADGWIAVAGSSAPSGRRPDSAFRVRSGEVLEFPPGPAGVWTCLALPGGFAGDPVLGSRSANPRAGIGRAGTAGDELGVAAAEPVPLPSAVAGRTLGPGPDGRGPEVPFRVWRGPQWDSFSAAVRDRFFRDEWTVSGQCDRVGYRLQGGALRAEPEQIVSEPVLPGSIQVPAGGQPIVTMPDGPTIGGYPKLGLVDPSELPRLAQCRPGRRIRFRLAE